MAASLKIGVLGTRGIPNRYGGFEQFAEYLAVGLVERGHQVWVYNAHNHEYKESVWNGVNIIHCKDPEEKLGTFGQFLYDLNCITDARRRKYDVLLQLGYTSNSIWYWRWPAYCPNIVNMDGLEWKRSKYNKHVRRFLKTAERLAAEHADILVADSEGIKQHLLDAYNRQSHFIPYGAEIFHDANAATLADYGLAPDSYYLLIARMEPENNIEMIIKGYLLSKAEKPLVVVGKTDNAFGAYLRASYGDSGNIRFLGGIYDSEVINNLRFYSSFYFHGHSVGGTNPSLLEAMACSALIAAHDNVFNRAVLGDDAFYFANDNDVSRIIAALTLDEGGAQMRQRNTDKINTKYSWKQIIDAYEQLFLQACL